MNNKNLNFVKYPIFKAYIVFYFSLFMSLFILACNQNLIFKTIEPTEKKINLLNTGDKITFSFGETMGINREEYPAPSYIFDYDTLFFKSCPSSTFNDGKAGGTNTTTYCYKATKIGTTKFIIHKKEMFLVRSTDSNGNEKTIYHDTTLPYSKYLFNIK